jgi:hypothetical protein
MEKIKLVGLLCVLGFSSFCSAFEVPHYQEVFKQQLKCDRQSFLKTFPWDKKPGLGFGGTDYIAVISKPTITEVSPSAFWKKITLPQRTFRVDFIGYAGFSCGERKPLSASQAKGEAKRIYFTLDESAKGSKTLGLYGADHEEYPQENEDLFDAPHFLFGNSGLHCAIIINDLLANPNRINVDQLCEGYSPEDKKATKRAISLAIGAWKEAGIKGSK